MLKIDKHAINSKDKTQFLCNLYRSRVVENIIFADSILDTITLNINDAHLVLKIIRNHCYKKSTYYLAKIKKRSVKNYIVVKRNERII